MTTIKRQEKVLALKDKILKQFRIKLDEHVSQIIPQLAIDNKLTMKSLVNDFDGKMANYVAFMKPKRRKKLVTKSSNQTAKELVQVPRRSRRITLKGSGIDDIELSCILPQDPLNNDHDDLDVDMESLDKEELIKMRNALRMAEQKANQLLANLGL